MTPGDTLISQCLGICRNATRAMFLAARRWRGGHRVARAPRRSASRRGRHFDRRHDADRTGGRSGAAPRRRLAAHPSTIVATRRSSARSAVVSRARTRFSARVFRASMIFIFPLALGPRLRSPAICSSADSPIRRRALRRAGATSTILFSGILDDPLGPGHLQPRNQIPDGPLLDDRVDRHPLVVAQRRDRRPLKRGQQREHARPGRRAAR